MRVWVFAAVGASLLMLDEPTSPLDRPAIEQLEQAVGHHEGTSLLLVMHDRRLLERLSLTHRVGGDGGRVTVELVSG